MIRLLHGVPLEMIGLFSAAQSITGFAPATPSHKRSAGESLLLPLLRYPITAVWLHQAILNGELDGTSCSLG
ncbi:hypothetical protein ACPOL_6593 [Acidisarcina polymorpha]|uniref:Uncharacterized protein n=1 Tax=Acidisarcina polymorpha TaxID=2211140 RepID=A0A2Z5GB00_9BACT|nr:hypothetical protein ACPOL_6593 [Acidisarcina polymorpha]